MQHVAHRASDEIAQLNEENKRLRAENAELKVKLSDLVGLAKERAKKIRDLNALIMRG